MVWCICVPESVELLSQKVQELCRCGKCHPENVHLYLSLFLSLSPSLLYIYSLFAMGHVSGTQLVGVKRRPTFTNLTSVVAVAVVVSVEPFHVNRFSGHVNAKKVAAKLTETQSTIDSMIYLQYSKQNTKKNQYPNLVFKFFCYSYRSGSFVTPRHWSW